MALYFLRHGESYANVADVFAGQRENSQLTQLGIEQAQSAGLELMTVSIDRIITSRLIRARRTAEEIAKIIGMQNIETDNRILEYDMGTLEGTPSRSITSQELISVEGAEDVRAFQRRVLSFLKEYKDNSENILMVSHAGVGRMIEASKQRLDPSEFYSIPRYPNAHAVKLDLGWVDSD